MTETGDRAAGGGRGVARRVALRLALPVLLLLPALPIAPFPAPAAAAQPLAPVTVVTGDWPPYVDQTAPGGGILAEVLSAALAGMGHRADYRYVPFYLALDVARHDGVAGTFPWFRTAEREADWVYGEEALFAVEYVFFVRRAALDRAGLDPAALDSPGDLAALRFGGVRGYAYPPAVERRIAPARRYPSEVAAFEALLDGKVDVLQSDRRVGMHLVTGPLADRRQQVEVLDRGALASRQPVYFLAARDRPGAEAFVARLDGELRRLKRAGFLAEVLGRADGERRRVVRLVGNDSFPLVVGHLERDGEEAILIPNGTRAVVLEWAERFHRPGPVRVHRDMFVKSRVRLLEGPRRGDTVWVQSLYIQLQ